jgi:signal transduction histidine kinase
MLSQSGERAHPHPSPYTPSRDRTVEGTAAGVAGPGREAILTAAAMTAGAFVCHLACGLDLRALAPAGVAALIVAAAGAVCFAVLRSGRQGAAGRILVAYSGAAICAALFTLDARNWAAPAALLLLAYVVSAGAGIAAGLGVAVAASSALALPRLLSDGLDTVSSSAAPLFDALLLLAGGGALALVGAAMEEERRRAHLLLEVSRISNPRFGTDRTLAVILQRLREHFAADSCILVAEEIAAAAATEPRYVLHRADAGGRGRAESAAPAAARLVPAAVAAPLLAIPPGAAALYRRGRGGVMSLLPVGRPAARIDPEEPGAAPAASAADLLREVDEELEAYSFLSVPVRSGAGRARIYLVRRGEGAGPFGPADLRFLLRAAAAFAPTVENVRLLDNMFCESAGRERRRIARDLHDTTIQPIIGLKMGLAAAREKLLAGRGAEAAAHIDRLIALTEEELGSLRGYVANLRDVEAPKTSFLTAVRHFTEKFGESSGIPVHLEVKGELAINDRLAAEAFQMIAEGLSNVRRHTGSKGAAVRLACEGGCLLLEISNWGCDRAAAGVQEMPQFRPRSLSERARALGGDLYVSAGRDGQTRLTIIVPL